MSEPFVIPRLGIVKAEDELVFYDGALLFTVRSDVAGRFLGFWALEELSQSVIWFAPLSDKRYRLLLRGEISVRDAISGSESILEAYRDKETFIYERSIWKTPSELEQAVLPEIGFVLPASEHQLALDEGFVTTAEMVATRLHKAVTRIIFDFGAGIYEGPASIIASAILNAQRVVDAIALSRSTEAGQRGRIPFEVSSRTLLSLRPLTAGSLGIELVSVEEGDLWNESTAGNSLQLLIRLLAAGSNIEALKAEFEPLSPRAAKSYKSLLQDFQKSSANVNVEIGLPSNRGDFRVRLSREQIPAIVEAMKTVERLKGVEYEFKGQLQGYDSQTRTFRIRRVGDDAEFKGKAIGSATESAAHATLSSVYSVTILEKINSDLITGEAKSEYELVHLVEMGENVLTESEFTER